MAAQVIKINESGITMGVGSARKLSITILPDDGGNTVVWSSSNTNAVVVDNNGYMIGKAAGNATITATLGGLTATCAIVVLANYAIVSLEEAKKRLSIDFSNQDAEIQSRINSAIAYLTYATGIKACDFPSLDTEAQNLAKEYILKSLYYDYYDLHSDLNDARLTMAIKQLQLIGGAL